MSKADDVTRVADFRVSGSLDWDSVARQVAAILNSPHCLSKAQDGVPQPPPWVGAHCGQGGIVLLAQNPSSVRDLNWAERRLRHSLKEQPNADQVATVSLIVNRPDALTAGDVAQQNANADRKTLTGDH